jgi:hypothetical protein
VCACIQRTYTKDEKSSSGLTLGQYQVLFDIRLIIQDWKSGTRTIGLTPYDVMAGTASCIAASARNVSMEFRTRAKVLTIDISMFTVH